MALVTAQKRQALRLPTPDATVDSLDQFAILGLIQVESSGLSTNQKRWILRLPIVDATVDELDAYGFLHIPAASGAGNTIDVFSLDWLIDPTWTFSEPSAATDGSVSVTLSQIITAVLGTNYGITPALEIVTFAEVERHTGAHFSSRAIGFIERDLGETGSSVVVADSISIVSSQRSISAEIVDRSMIFTESNRQVSFQDG